MEKQQPGSSFEVAKKTPERSGCATLLIFFIFCMAIWWKPFGFLTITVKIALTVVGLFAIIFIAGKIIARSKHGKIS